MRVREGMAFSASERISEVYSSSKDLTAAIADVGGPQSGTDEPMASQVMLTQDSSGVPAAMCSSVLFRSSLRSPAPSFAPNAATVCRRLTLPAAFRSPPRARASAASFSVGSILPLRGPAHTIRS